NDPGAIGPSGLMERDVVTDISNRLKVLLEAKGATVIMTRSGDTTSLELDGRATVANNNNADIFVSVHANASLSSAQNGTSVYYYAPLNSELASQRPQRRQLAQAVQDELVKELKLRDMGIFDNNFAVLRHTAMPSILVEVAFISNPVEEQLLADNSFRQRSAEAILAGISTYFVNN
ncbi:MAG: N-acetylmuramoyl-L-alanine amidase, partial [Bacillota bacterium]|nr:N-acetylmuramoyl-L-alanine amidase [Bacillota bacterium]